MTARQLIHHARDPTSPSQNRGRATAIGRIPGTSPGFGSFLDAKDGSHEHRPQLPLAIPRGFVTLQSRVYISESLMALLSRTSCFDFISQGTETRLQQLLVDLTFRSHEQTAAGACDSPLQDYLRIACISMSIYQGQHTDAAVFARDDRYQRGLEAAWSEAWLLDRNALRTPQSAEASLWAVFIISVTTGTSSNLFRPLLCTLLQDLHLSSWVEVRSVLLGFIYPVSLFDGPCRMLYDALF
ncbi:hypothetical protein BDY17DRAFT_321403 [Neohortaea acidophila]|uniref:Uncharacterized protein n=1 Tax=Neohortaea acidophila TaxID=245834 RepID=A0A6A6Q3U0_9PEZI|nr:uncharacterized protein BDY17DRAFT_321403 [Neohortaea acidophila]KAF2486626.1 hypothetical protein BDY17DRAFT_321403 [Neohortaea acidophila]